MGGSTRSVPIHSGFTSRHGTLAAGEAVVMVPLEPKYDLLTIAGDAVPSDHRPETYKSPMVRTGPVPVMPPASLTGSQQPATPGIGDSYVTTACPDGRTTEGRTGGM